MAPTSQTEEHHHRAGIVLDRGWRYDLQVWFTDRFVMHGRIRDLRREVLDAAELSDGQMLLDVGCGTGSLALEAARRIPARRSVAGIDPAPRQLARARSKARRAGLDVDFREASVEDLPFPDASFDAVTGTLMMHHLPGELKKQGLSEIRRVLKPGGRLVIADFDYADGAHRRGAGAAPASGYAETEDLPRLLEEAGFAVVRTAQTPLPRMHRGWSGIRLLAAVPAR
jgi:ubiquinone/menaquinone biosynthesis C-methylase UbiE